MTTRREFLRLAAAPTAALAGLRPAVARGQEKEILFGATQPLSGALAREGTLGKQGLELAVNEINAAGGIRSMRGARLRLLVVDNGSTPAGAIAAMERLNQMGALAVIGPRASDLALVTMQEAQKHRVPHVVDGAIVDAITARGSRYTFRPGPNATIGTKTTVASLGAVVKALKLPWRRVAVLYEDGAFGRTTAETLRRLLPDAGLEMVEGVAHANGTRTFTNEVLKVKAARPHVIVITTYVPAHLDILRATAEQRVDAGAIVSIYGGLGRGLGFVQAAGKLAEYTLDSTHWYNPKHPRIAGLLAAFQKTYGQPFAQEWLLAYQAVHVVRDALERAGAPDRERLRDALARTHLRDQVVPYPITFDEHGQNPHARPLLVQVQRGTPLVVHPEPFAQAPPALPAPAWDRRLGT